MDNSENRSCDEEESFVDNVDPGVRSYLTQNAELEQALQSELQVRQQLQNAIDELVAENSLQKRKNKEVTTGMERVNKAMQGTLMMLLQMTDNLKSVVDMSNVSAINSSASSPIKNLIEKNVCDLVTPPEPPSKKNVVSPESPNMNSSLPNATSTARKPIKPNDCKVVLKPMSMSDVDPSELEEAPLLPNRQTNDWRDLSTILEGDTSEEVTSLHRTPASAPPSSSNKRRKSSDFKDVCVRLTRLPSSTVKQFLSSPKKRPSTITTSTLIEHHSNMSINVTMGSCPEFLANSNLSSISQVSLLNNLGLTPVPSISNTPSPGPKMSYVVTRRKATSLRATSVSDNGELSTTVSINSLDAGSSSSRRSILELTATNPKVLLPKIENSEIPAKRMKRSVKVEKMPKKIDTSRRTEGEENKPGRSARPLRQVKPKVYTEPSLTKKLRRS